MNQKHWTEKKKLMAMMDKIISDFCETHTDEEIAEADRKTQAIVDRVRRRQKERKQRYADKTNNVVERKKRVAEDAGLVTEMHARKD